jgi:excisionase family DNA binding protein
MPVFEPTAFAFSPANAARFSGLGLTRVKALLRDGTIPRHKDGRRTLILRSDIEAYLTRLSRAAYHPPRRAGTLRTGGAALTVIDARKAFAAPHGEDLACRFFPIHLQSSISHW